jgi:dihydrofolate reductase
MKTQPTIISLIVACDNQGGIAKNGSIPWNFPQELRYFSKVTRTTEDPTKKNAILMGRKTWESLPRRPLPNRVNIVLSSKPNSSGDPNPNIVFVSSIEIALEYVNQNEKIEDLFVIGGEQIYHTFMTEYSSMIDHIYYTEIQENYLCDQFFPVTFLHHYALKMPNGNVTFNSFVADESALQMRKGVETYKQNNITTDTDITTNTSGDLRSPSNSSGLCSNKVAYLRAPSVLKGCDPPLGVTDRVSSEEATRSVCPLPELVVQRLQGTEAPQSTESAQGLKAPCQEFIYYRYDNVKISI